MRRITPHTMHAFHQQYTKFTQETSKLELPPTAKKHIQEEHHAIKNAPLYYIPQEQTQYVLDNYNPDPTTNPQILSDSGMLIFENGTGLTQPYVLDPFGTNHKRTEIYGIFWYYGNDKKLALYPIVQASALREINPKYYAPKKYFPTWAPMLTQELMITTIGLKDGLEQPFYLLKSISELKMSAHTEKIRTTQGKKTISVKYSVLEQPIIDNTIQFKKTGTSPTDLPFTL